MGISKRHFPILVSLLPLLSASIKLRVPPPRTCEELSLVSGDPIEFYDLPPEYDARNPVPFSVTVDEFTQDVQIYIGTGDVVGEESFYIITMGRELRIEKVTSDSPEKRRLLDRIETKTLGVPGMTKGYYFRLKVRDDFTQVGLYDGGEDAAEPIITYKDVRPPKAAMTHYGFAVRSNSNDDAAKVRIQHNCESGIGSKCLHDTECTAQGTICLPHGVDATCDCDEDHVLDRLRMECKTNPIKIGEECTDSKQCARLDAKCRTVKGSRRDKKVCTCLNTHYVDAQGSCSEVQGKVDLDIKSLFREPTWKELNPGRRQYNFKDEVLGHGADDYPLPKTPRIFPLTFLKNGFEMSFFAKGSGSLKIPFTHHGEPHRKNEVVFTLEIEEHEMRLFEGKQNVDTKSFSETLLDSETTNTFWVSLQCPYSPLSENCDFLVGSVGRDAPYLTSPVRNPWSFSSHPNVDLVHPWVPPTHFAFVGGSPSSSLSVTSSCTSSHGQRCSHNDDCKKANADLICEKKASSSEARCVCGQQSQWWDKTSRTCV